MSEFKISDNTVSRVNQVINSSNLYFLGNEKDYNLKVLILGNSITRHGPNAEIGWMNDWGMAASKKENDFVHVLYGLLEKSGIKPYFMVRQAADFERRFNEVHIFDNYIEDKKFNADVIIFRLGENVSRISDEYSKAFGDKSFEFINYLKNKDTKVIVTDCFWEYDLLDKHIKSMTQRLDAYFIHIGDLGLDDTMRATGLFEHSGVAGHPGDLGMKNIAERIFEELKKAVKFEY